MPAGRPLKYNEEYCKRAVAFLSKGNSVTELSAHLDIAKATIYDWAIKYEKFSDALKRGGELSQAHWETELKQMMYSRDVNAPLVKLYFANRFGWSDKKEQTIDPNTKIKVEFV